MVIAIFGSLIGGVIIIYMAQKAKTKKGRIIMRVIGFLVMFWFVLFGLWNNFIAG